MDELVALLKHPRVCLPEAVHDHSCRYWREGKSHGPCTCGAQDLDIRLRVAMIASGIEVNESPNEKAEREAHSATVSQEQK